MVTQGKDIVSVFRGLYQSEPFLFFSPGRINLIGEHIDYNDGFVMPAAIDRGIWFAVAPNHSEDIHVYSTDTKEYLSISLHDIKKIEGWKNYILGVVNELQERKYAIRGFDVVFGGNLPVGAGLSSSAAVECGLCFGLNTIFDLNISRVEIALISQRAEHEFPGVMCGIMDQFANMMGKKDHVLLLDCNSLEYETIPLNLEDYSIVLFNSGVHHSLAGGEYNIRRRQCEEGLKQLKSLYKNATGFRTISPEQVVEAKSAMKDIVFRRCLFVAEEIQRTKRAAALLKQNRLKEFGELMFATHEGLSVLYNVSCEELDFLVREAEKFPEVIGARMMGGGFGGCTINIIEKDSLQKIANQITQNYRMQFGIDAEVYGMRPDDGTHEVNKGDLLKGIHSRY